MLGYIRVMDWRLRIGLMLLGTAALGYALLHFSIVSTEANLGPRTTDIDSRYPSTNSTWSPAPEPKP